MIAFPLMNAFLLFCLGCIHFYWVFGGKRGLESAVPKMEEKPLFKPGKLATFLVGLGLSAFGFFHLATLDSNLLLPDGITKWALLAIAIIFLVRAIGDFKYVGFFKKIRGTSFAKMDTKYYSPLCLLMSINAGISYTLT